MTPSRGLVVLLGACYRGDRRSAVSEQAAAFASHQALLDRLARLGVRCDVFVDTYASEHGGPSGVRGFLRHRLARVHPAPVGWDHLVRDALDMVRPDLDQYDFALFVRCDLELKPEFVETFVPRTDRILFSSVCFSRDGCDRTATGEPRVADMLALVPRELFWVLHARGHASFLTHDGYDELLARGVPRDRIGFFVPTLHDSDSAKDWNPMYRVVGRPESAAWRDDPWRDDPWRDRPRPDRLCDGPRAGVVFDLDGVLVDTRDLHFHVLNEALPPEFRISREEHLARYDGNPTRAKLDRLTREKGLPRELHDAVWAEKQRLTLAGTPRYVRPDARVAAVMRALRLHGFGVAVASNATRAFIDAALEAAGLAGLAHHVVSCEDVGRPKPAPDVFARAFDLLGVPADRALVLEDSDVGLRAARASGARVLPVTRGAEGVTWDAIVEALAGLTALVPLAGPSPRRLNVVVPMAGAGSRFAAQGYELPKPLIDVRGRPMIARVVENLGFADARFVFVVQRAWATEEVRGTLEAIAPGCAVVELDGLTQGAACSVLAARDLIDCDDALVIANSDQLLDWDPRAFQRACVGSGDAPSDGAPDARAPDARAPDGVVSVFRSQDPKFSYARLDAATGLVDLVAEKRVISELATTGVYYWARGSDFCRCAQRMIDADRRVNGEFYVAPVYNEAITEGMRVAVDEAPGFWCLGTPEDLRAYLASRGRC